MPGAASSSRRGLCTQTGLESQLGTCRWVGRTGPVLPRVWEPRRRAPTAAPSALVSRPFGLTSARPPDPSPDQHGPSESSFLPLTFLTTKYMFFCSITATAK